MGMKILCLVALSMIQTVDGEMPCLQSIKAIKYVLHRNYTGLQRIYRCESGWKQYNKHCYYYNLNVKSWHNAEIFCNERNSSLVKLDDYMESWWVTIAGGRPSWWIGVNDLATEGTWVWKSDSTPIEYTSWDRSVNPPKPSGGGSADCVTTYGNNKDGVWGDLPCSATLSSVCEKEATST